MKYTLKLVKSAIGRTSPQDENNLSAAKFAATGALGLVVAAAGVVSGQGTTTSPLEILKQAPKVRIENDPPPTPRPNITPVPARQTPEPPPYVPPRGAAPYVEPVYPAFTPYNNSAYGAPQRQEPAYPPYGAQPQTMTPTPRPVLGPEDVEPQKKKGGIVRGLIRAIPFVGGDDDENATPTPQAGSLVPDYQSAPPPDYRGYDDPVVPSDPGREPLLLAPGTLPADPTPSSPPAMSSPEVDNPISAPPILTPEPRVPAPIEPPVDLNNVNPPPIGASQPEIDAGSGRPVLTVRRETDTTTATEEPLDASPSVSEEPKAPSRAEATPTPTPRPLERATTGVLIQESRPTPILEEDSSLGPRPGSSATIVEPYDPSANATALTTADDQISSLTIEQADLGMPNPAYEQNTSVLAAFQAAVRLARGGDHEGAAKAFREYTLNHPSSGLAPRAAYLSVIFEKSRRQARENLETLERQFPKSRYVAEARKRRGDEIALAEAAGPTATGADDISAGDTTITVTPADVPATNELPAQQIARLERELTAAVGDPALEPAIRKRLGLLYIQQEEWDRAYEILRPAAEMAEGQRINGEITLALGRTLMARGETVQAISLYEAVEAKHPGLIESDAATAWSVGLAYEGAGKFARARSLYSILRQRFPSTAEAGWATTRLNELAVLRR